MNNKQPYRSINNLYNTEASIKLAKQRSRDKIFKVIFATVCVAITIAATLALHAFTVWRNGHEGIGGECTIPLLAIGIYIVYRSMEYDRKRREAIRVNLENELEELRMKERKINVVVVREEGYQDRWLEAIASVYKKRLKNETLKDKQIQVKDAAEN